MIYPPEARQSIKYENVLKTCNAITHLIAYMADEEVT